VDEAEFFRALRDLIDSPAHARVEIVQDEFFVNLYGRSDLTRIPLGGAIGLGVKVRSTKRVLQAAARKLAAALPDFTQTVCGRKDRDDEDDGIWTWCDVRALLEDYERFKKAAGFFYDAAEKAAAVGLGWKAFLAWLALSITTSFLDELCEC